MIAPLDHAAQHIKRTQLLGAEIADPIKQGETLFVQAQEAVVQQLATFSGLSAPYLLGFGSHLLMALSPRLPLADALDDWQATADNVTVPAITTLPSLREAFPRD